jgi:thioredoxin reductase (NADPH)
VTGSVDLLPWLVYGVPLAGIWLIRGLRQRARHRRAATALAASRAAGLTEPSTLHPQIDASLCLGCGTCVTACPEGDVLGMVSGKARLVNPTHCIGHGACQEACPQDAISLVLGTENRPIEIPVSGPDFQTNVRGLFVAGEIAGMGLIRNAVEQGRQAMEAIRALPGIGSGAGLDVAIVGAGPAGIAATLAAQEAGLRYVTLEQDTLGGTVSHFPRGKIVMTRPVDLPLVGSVRFAETTKEKLLEFWRRVEAETGIRIQYRERVEKLQRGSEGFSVETSRGHYHARAVLMAIGRRGTPRRLGVPGEERTKVVYSLIDPEQYAGQRVLVVGGGDSALEAALAISEQPGTGVALSYRGESFSRAKPKNRQRLEAAAAAGALALQLGSSVAEIRESDVALETAAGRVLLPNDAVIVCAGGELPTQLLQMAGIEIQHARGLRMR